MRLPFACLLLAACSPLQAAPLAPFEDAPLRAVQFVDAREGWAVGDQGVVWHSIDGGKSWERQPTGTKAFLRSVHFVTPYSGWVVGRTELPNGAGSAGVVLSTTDGGITWKERSSGQLPGLNRVTFADEKNGTMTGDGVSLTTKDGGETWLPTVTPSKGEPAPTKLPTGGSFAPMRAGHYLDANTGWAVGEMGTVLGTTDGGKTWVTLKSGGQKAAALFLHARAEATPLGAVALLAKDGYHAVAVSIEKEREHRLASAMRMVGGMGGEADGSKAWPAYLREKPAVGEPAMLPTARDEELLGRLVLAIRTWRPEVVVTDLLSPDAPLCDQQVLLHMRDAFTMAADATAFPEQIKDLGLAPHAAKKLYAMSNDDKDANVVLDLTAFVPEFGEAAKDVCEPAALVLGAANPDRVRFRLIAHRLPGSEQHTALMQGIELAPGGPSRRPAAKPDPQFAATLPDREKWSKTRRQLEALLAHPETAGGWEAALAQALGSIRGMPDDLAARTATSLGMRLSAAGQWTAARELFAVVADKYPAHAESVEAIRWLIRYHASAETQRRLELGHFPIFQKAAFAEMKQDVQQVTFSEPLLATAKYRLASPQVEQQWSQYALDLEPKLAAFGGVYVRDAKAQLPLNAARRRLGLYADALKIAKAVAPGEAAVLDGQGTLPLCRRAETAPLLDGKLDEACWKDAASLETAVKGYPAKVMFASDDRFLYVAAVCEHPQGKQVAKAEKRSRDETLTGRDRVEITLDLDRDRETYFRLCVDHRGCLSEDCTGDATWNPRWFAAVEPTADRWVAEIAIPLSELTGAAVADKAVWMIEAKRIVPGVGEASEAKPLKFTK